MDKDNQTAQGLSGNGQVSGTAGDRRRRSPAQNDALTGFRNIRYKWGAQDEDLRRYRRRNAELRTAGPVLTGDSSVHSFTQGGSRISRSSTLKLRQSRPLAERLAIRQAEKSGSLGSDGYRHAGESVAPSYKNGHNPFANTACSNGEDIISSHEGLPHSSTSPFPDYIPTSQFENISYRHHNPETDLSDHRIDSTSVGRTTSRLRPTDLVPQVNLNENYDETGCPSCLTPLMEVSALCLYCGESKDVGPDTLVSAPWEVDE